MDCSLFFFLSIVLLVCLCVYGFFFFFKQKTAYEMRISDWSSDVCSSDLDIHSCKRGPAAGEMTPNLFHVEGMGEFRIAPGTKLGGQPINHLGRIQKTGGVQWDIVRHWHADGRDHGVSPPVQPLKRLAPIDRKSTRLNSSHKCAHRMPASACNKKRDLSTIH